MLIDPPRRPSEPTGSIIALARGRLRDYHSACNRRTLSDFRHHPPEIEVEGAGGEKIERVQPRAVNIGPRGVPR